MQQFNRSGRAARSSRAHSRHQSASASDNQNVSESHPSSDKPTHNPSKSSARQAQSSAPPRGRRTHLRHRKPKNRTEPIPAAATASTSDMKPTDRSVPASASNNANELQSQTASAPAQPMQSREDNRSASMHSDPGFASPSAPVQSQHSSYADGSSHSGVPSLSGKQAPVEHSESPCESQQSFVFSARASPFNQGPCQLVSPNSQPSGQGLAVTPVKGMVQEANSKPNANPIAAGENDSVGQTDNAQDSSVASDHKPRIDCKSEEEVDRIAELVSRIKAPSHGPRARSLICQDITSSNADTLRISRLPRDVTYDILFSMVEPFGDVEDLVWVPSDPYVCEVRYRDPAAAHEAKHFLGDAIVGSDAEPPLKVELYSRDPSAQLFVGDLTPDVTEEMLETAFSKLVGEPVTALLKRDPNTFVPIGYGFLSFKSESSANFALVAGHRAKIGNACVRVGRAERNTYLYISDLSPNVTMPELKEVFGKFGSLEEEDTVIVKRTYAFVRYKNRKAAEKAKRTLDKTDLKGHLSVRYAEAEPLKACVAVQFHSSVPRPPHSLRDLLNVAFSKYGNCSVQIPRLANGMWRKVAFVTYHGDPIAANLAALEALQTIRFVSSLPVCCQFARELIPRLPPKGLVIEKNDGSSVARSSYDVPPEGVTAKLTPAKKAVTRRSENVTGGAKGSSSSGPVNPNRRGNQFRNDGHGRGPNYVPVYVPLTALQHPNTSLPPGSVIGDQSTSAPYHWSGRGLVPGSASEGVGPHGNHMGSNYNSFGPDRYSRW